MLGLASKTDPAWLSCALAALDEVLVDHAHCEHKAAVTALAFVSKYPDDPELVTRLAALAAEESEHLQRMATVCHQRGLDLGHPDQDPYAKRLLAHARGSELERRVDRLLICSLIEARSCERLRLLAEGLATVDNEADRALAPLYDELWRCEAGHFTLFCDLATRQLERRGNKSPEEARRIMKARLLELAEAEAAIVADLPILPRVH